MTTRPEMDLLRFPYLQGNYAPVLEESTLNEGEGELRVEGTIPANITGAFMRNGPNVAWQPDHYVYPVDGDGMIHAIYIKDGRVHYRNRWVQTQSFKIEAQFQRACWGSHGKPHLIDKEVIAAGGSPNPLKNPANTNVLFHGDKLFALFEAGFPHLLNSDLTTVGEYDYDGLLQAGDGLTAHPKICSRNGDLISNTQTFSAPYFTVQIFDKSGRHKRSIPIHGMHRRAMIHDMQICGDYIVGFFAPAFPDIEAAMRGENPFVWEADRATRIFVVHREAGEPLWFEAPTFFSWHFCNGFQSGENLYIDYVWMDSMPVSNDLGTGVEAQMRNMHRLTLNLKTQTLSDEKLGTTYCEFPRADSRRCGQSYRYGFAAASTQSWADDPNHGYNATIAYDMDSGHSQLWDYGVGANAGEPVHVPSPDSAKEEDGYLMCYVNSPEEGAYLSILSAGDLTRGPLAKISIPVRVPNGFHANWMNGMTL
ncbi:carotenoid oxygenase family protein [Oceanicoccus sp. KOV_DT_Chl]|uniref:carotenoid oxygenase family protein n=1 Tax=Oceanicoccus sp. KOV_DT_Chl TaxID=1904639 RepID=UPI000C7E27B2|nr:carotenoid oxygenase family protein [Oceanicoccus sp. KOV_DT_Chl]